MIKPKRSQLLLIVVIGIIGVSLAAIWIRLAMETETVLADNKIGFSLFLAATRMILAGIILLPSWQNLKLKPINSLAVYYAIAAGLCLAIHFATWITSLAYTSIAASTVLVTTNPIWVGLFSWWWYQQKLTRSQVIGMGIALTGGIIIAIADSSCSNSNPILGDFLALSGAIMSSLYIIFGNQAQLRGLDTKSYIAIAYSMAALGLFPLPFLFGVGYLGYQGQVYVYVLLMALLSQVVGHTSLNWSMRWLSPTLISLCLLFEPVVASLTGAIVFQEVPSTNLLLGGLMILWGIGVFILANRELGN